MDISLDGSRAFVTAGGAGMGRATVLAMHEAGAEVFTCDIDSSGLASLPSAVTSWTCDVSRSVELDAVFDEILPGGLHILVNNAGIAGPTKPVEEISDDEWRTTMAVGIDAQFFCVRRAVPGFKAQGGGAIVNLGSGAGILGYPNRAPYASAKWAVSGFTKSLAMELGPHNIRVNCVAPGNVKGDRLDRVIADHAGSVGLTEDEIRHRYAIGTSMNCFVEPEEIADTIVFLCSSRGRHISGQIIAVDGHTETLYPRL